MTLEELIAQYQAPQTANFAPLLDPLGVGTGAFSSTGNQMPYIAPGELRGTQTPEGNYLAALSGPGGGNLRHPETGKPGDVVATYGQDGALLGTEWRDFERSGFGNWLLQNGWMIPLAAAGVGMALGPGAGLGGTIGSAAPLEAGLANVGSSWAGGGSGLTAGSLGTGLTAGAGGVTGIGGASAGMAAAPASGGLLSGAASTIGGMLGGSGSWLAPAIGAVAGLASSGEKTAEQTSTRQLDPDVRNLYFGDGGLIPTAKALYQTNPTGMNDMRRGALNNLAGFFDSDAYLAPYQQQAQIANQMLAGFSAPPPAPAARAPVQGWGYNPASLLMPR